MTSVGTLWTIDVQVKGNIIRAAAAQGEIIIDLPESYTHRSDNQKPEFLSKFPHGKIPSFEGKDGFKLFEGAAIARYISALAPNSGLLGKDLEESALVDQWVHLAETEFDELTNAVAGLLYGRIVPYHKNLHASVLERQLRTLTTFNGYLASHTFLVGERLTLADITVAAFVHRACNSTIDTAVRTKIPNVIRHAETVLNQPKIKHLFGPINHLEKALQYVPPVKEKKEAKPV